MTEKFRNRYRIASARLQTWDYGRNGAYFITICTGNRNCYFGNIQSGVMHLSELGHIARKLWLEIPAHFPFVKLSGFVVMPDHIHGIIIIDKPQTNNNENINTVTVETPNLGVSTVTDPKIGDNSKKWKPATIGVIINQYKRIVTINARLIDPGFRWQPRFHDHIIRNAGELNRIRNYIINNPAKWRDDDFY
ncbi:MAG: hypothetical protein ACUVTX_04735 [Bacteroidales bacterium]